MSQQNPAVAGKSSGLSVLVFTVSHKKLILIGHELHVGRATFFRLLTLQPPGTSSATKSPQTFCSTPASLILNEATRGGGERKRSWVIGHVFDHNCTSYIVNVVNLFYAAPASSIPFQPFSTTSSPPSSPVNARPRKSIFIREGIC